ncbi:unnamed protein product [Rotaria sp. Silwood2]|nr:unnamed protein product [Rotaria sp. Silwood2]CAF2931001.1 unnamed protein product [Rotaria sp. Silwood2]CAF3963902.1 unnamed protein product [Rotaria sp. Silwood2]
MDSSMERPQSPLVVFGPNHIDTSRAEMLVQCLSNKIKEKRFKLQKMVAHNEEKKKRNELMENEKIQLTTKLTNIEHENSIREQQLQSEQLRIKELQFNIQMLDDHSNSIKRDCTNEERKYDQEKSLLINKFERIKQQWTEIFKPQYEQSKVYQYLKQGDLAYNSLVERRDALLKKQKLAYKDYLTRRQEFCNEKKFQSSILSIAKYFISQRDQLTKIKQMKERLIELENKQKQLLESKLDKMKAWENVYTQPIKRDLLDFCLQTNIEQALTLSFNQIQQDSWSQPATPMAPPPVLTPQNEQIELVREEQINNKPSLTFQSSTSIIHDETAHQVITPSSTQLVASTITIVPNMTKDVPLESNRSSVFHLTTAIDDDDDELFSKSRRKIPTVQMEQMTINDYSPSTQAFMVSKNSNIDVDQEVSSISQNDQSLTQAFTIVSTPTPLESHSVRDLVTPATNIQIPESISIPSTNTTVNKIHSTIAFQLPNSRIQNQPVTTSTTSSIQPQVTSNDVQQMLLTFSPDPSSINDEQPQPMEYDSVQSQQQQRPTFSMASSIESTTSNEDGYTGFNYNFGFDNNTTGDTTVGGGGFTSPINFGNWTNLGSPITTDSNEQFPAFLQQTNNANNSVDTSFPFASFSFDSMFLIFCFNLIRIFLFSSIFGVGGNETSTDGAFNSFFFGNSGSPMNTEETHDGKRN